MDELYAYRIYTPEELVKYKIPLQSVGYMFDNIDDFYDDWKYSDLRTSTIFEIEAEKTSPFYGIMNEKMKVYKYFYLLKTPHDKLIPWTMASCTLKVGDEISLIERHSHFIVKEIKYEGIATQEVDLITWDELLLYFIDADKNRCCAEASSLLCKPETNMKDIFYLSTATPKDIEKYEGTKGYFGSRPNRLVLFKKYKSKSHYGTLEVESGLFKNKETKNCYRYFMPEEVI